MKKTIILSPSDIVSRGSVLSPGTQGDMSCMPSSRNNTVLTNINNSAYIEFKDVDFGTNGQVLTPFFKLLKNINMNPFIREFSIHIMLDKLDMDKIVSTAFASGIGGTFKVGMNIEAKGRAFYAEGKHNVFIAFCGDEYTKKEYALKEQGVAFLAEIMEMGFIKELRDIKTSAFKNILNEDSVYQTGTIFYPGGTGGPSGFITNLPTFSENKIKTVHNSSYIRIKNVDFGNSEKYVTPFFKLKRKENENSEKIQLEWFPNKKDFGDRSFFKSGKGYNIYVQLDKLSLNGNDLDMGSVVSKASVPGRAQFPEGGLKNITGGAFKAEGQHDVFVIFFNKEAIEEDIMGWQFLADIEEAYFVEDKAAHEGNILHVVRNDKCDKALLKDKYDRYWDLLAQLEPMAKNEMISSYDVDGGNDDGLGWKHKQKVPGVELLNINGPGMLCRMQITNYDENTVMKFYIDGNETPVIDCKVRELFDRRHPPFLEPLVGGVEVSSGGSYFYVPICFKQSLRIVADYMDFYGIQFKLYPYETPIMSYTGNEDLSGYIRNFMNAATDYKELSGASINKQTLTIEKDTVTTVFEDNKAGAVSYLSMTFSGIYGVSVNTNSSDGKRTSTSRMTGVENKAESSFRVKINRDNEGVIIRRLVTTTRARADYQNVLVYVDGEVAGSWYTGLMLDGFNTGNPDPTVCNSYFTDFKIEGSLCSNKEQIKLDFRYNGGFPYSEYIYEIYSITNGDAVLTDKLIVGEKDGNLGAESHRYFSNKNELLERTLDLTYRNELNVSCYKKELWEEILNNTYIRIFWNGELTPSIDIPVCMFFGYGMYGPYVTKSLHFGVLEDGMMYNSHIMPYEKSCKIQMYTIGNINVPKIEFAVTTVPYKGDYALSGVLKAEYNSVYTKKGFPSQILNTLGSGSIVDIIQCGEGILARGWMEGDEAFYIDGARSWTIHGTGLEDFYNGAYYYSRDLFTLPTHGANAHDRNNRTDRTSMYRSYAYDKVDFRNGAIVNAEHGGANDLFSSGTKMDNLCFYYNAPPIMHKTDHIQVIEDGLQNEAYDTYGNKCIETRDFDLRFQQEYKYEFEKLKGVKVADRSGFEAKINLGNMGIVIRGLFAGGNVAYGESDVICTGGEAEKIRESKGLKLRGTYAGGSNYRADIYVDGEFAGNWKPNHVSQRENSAWEEDFFIHEKFTAGKSDIKIEIKPNKGAIWYDIKYDVFSIAFGD